MEGVYSRTECELGDVTWSPWRTESWLSGHPERPLWSEHPLIPRCPKERAPHHLRALGTLCRPLVPGRGKSSFFCRTALRFPQALCGAKAVRSKETGSIFGDQLRRITMAGGQRGRNRGNVQKQPVPPRTTCTPGRDQSLCYPRAQPPPLTRPAGAGRDHRGTSGGRRGRAPLGSRRKTKRMRRRHAERGSRFILISPASSPDDKLAGRSLFTEKGAACFTCFHDTGAGGGGKGRSRGQHGAGLHVGSGRARSYSRISGSAQSSPVTAVISWSRVSFRRQTVKSQDPTSLGGCGQEQPPGARVACGAQSWATSLPPGPVASRWPRGLESPPGGHEEEPRVSQLPNRLGASPPGRPRQTH